MKRQNLKASISEVNVGAKIFEIRKGERNEEDTAAAANCDRYLSPKNAADHLDVSVKFIYELMQSGKIRSQPVGGRLKRILKRDLDDWLTSQATKQRRSA